MEFFSGAFHFCDARLGLTPAGAIPMTTRTARVGCGAMPGWFTSGFIGKILPRAPSIRSSA